MRAIVQGPSEDWEPEAVDAAKTELEKRGIDIAVGGPYRAAPIGSQGMPLDSTGAATSRKVTAFFFGLFLSLLAVAVAFMTLKNKRKQGRAREGRELLTWTIVGAATGFVLGVVVRSGA